MKAKFTHKKPKTHFKSIIRALAPLAHQAIRYSPRIRPPLAGDTAGCRSYP
jgi:hypothetical protein